MVIFIDKKDKDSVRPISLSSCFGKLYERIINERLNWRAEHNGIYDRFQNGFRRNKSCLENIARLSSNVRMAIYKNQGTLAGFLDIPAAYDSVLYGILINKLIDLKCPAGLVNAVSSWLHFREVKFVVEEDFSIKRTVCKGLPQGAVLSPMLYNLYTCQISVRLPLEVRCVQFADDIAIWSSSASFDLRRTNIESAFDILYNNLSELGLELQPKKTNVIDFGKAGFSRSRGYVRCRNQEIPIKREAKFLGIIFDNRLQYDIQCRKIKEKVIRANNLLKYMSKITWGLEVNTALMLYKSLVRSIIDYGSVFFVPNCNNQSRLNIERAQYAGLRTALARIQKIYPN